MNRNILKSIAFLTMLIDHIGAVFFPNMFIFRIIGRVSFPIFAFFIAEGWFYTRNKKTYFLTLLVLGLVTQIPYTLLFDVYSLNILFTFVFSLIFIIFLEKIKKEPDNFALLAFAVFLNLLVIILFMLNALDYGYLGVIIPVVFYSFREQKIIKFSIVAVLLLIMSALYISFSSLENMFPYIQLFSLLSLPILMAYNNQKGKLNTKYFFYIFYFLHIVILLFIKTIMIQLN